MPTYAKVVKIHEEYKLSVLTVGALYLALEPGEEVNRCFGYDFALIDDEGDKMPFRWENDIEAEFQRVEK